MTAQIDDTFDFAGETWSLAGVSEGELFDPSMFDLHLTFSCTACWRMYVVRYAVKSGQLIIKDLHMNIDKKALSTSGGRIPGPIINGVLPSEAEDEPSTAWFCNSHYIDLNLPLPYNGGVLLGDSFISDLFENMGFQPAWKYERIHELVFENGRLASESDKSREMAAYRRELLAERSRDTSRRRSPAEVKAWISEAFDRSYPHW